MTKVIARNQRMDKLKRLRTIGASKKVLKIKRCGETDPKKKALTAQGFLEINGLIN